ncbi:MAG: hypothetical protein NC823_00220 [Candidatus Omnitrophica bacterium]|nr:hypothetical protein [Candidatus Omnitrophota bacterium]
MKAAFQEEDITPWVGTERPGGYGKAYNQEVHDPIKIRALMVDDGEKTAVFIGTDLLVIPRKLVVAIRERLQQKFNLPPESILIAASHTHSSGPVFGLFPEEYQEAPSPVKDLIVKHSTIPDPFYTDLVIEKATAAVSRCQRKLAEVSLSFWKGKETSCIFNRRFRMKNGRTYTHPGKGNPDIVAPAGPVDPEVIVIGVWTNSNRLLACLVNYACHGTTGPGGVSADWVFYLEETIRKVMGKSTGLVFLNGACGDVTQVDNLSSTEIEFGENYAWRLGQRVAAEALKGLAYPPVGSATIDFRNKILKIPRRKPSPTRVKDSWEIVQNQVPHSSTDWTFAKELIIADYLTNTQPVAEIEIQAIKLGPSIFITNPGEFFCSLGLGIKKVSHFPYTVVVELANGCAGYIPDACAFQADGGGYETILTSYSNLVPEAGEIIVRESVSLLNQIQPDSAPSYPSAKPFGSPWDYGIRGPELE